MFNKILIRMAKWVKTLQLGWNPSGIGNEEFDNFTKFQHIHIWTGQSVMESG